MDEHFILPTSSVEVFGAMSLRMMVAAIAFFREPFLHMAFSIFGDVVRCQHDDGGLKVKPWPDHPLGGGRNNEILTSPPRLLAILYLSRHENDQGAPPGAP